MLELLFNEPQLLIVYCVALEIDMVYAPTHEERAAFQRLTVDDMIAIQDGETTLTREGTMHQQKKVFLKNSTNIDHLHSGKY